MMRTRLGLLRVGVVIAMTLAVGIGVGSAPGAMEGGWEAGPVTIRVELGTPFVAGASPKVFERRDVVPGQGPELTPDDVIANPSNLCGQVTVDIDPASHTVTLSAGPEPSPAIPPIQPAGETSPPQTCATQRLSISITGAHFTTFAVQSNTLFGHYQPVTTSIPGAEGSMGTPTTLHDPIPQMNLVSLSATVSGAQAEWIDEALAAIVPPGENGAGLVVFTYELAAPTSPTTVPPSTVVSPAGAARPVTATPRFTG